MARSKRKRSAGTTSKQTAVNPASEHLEELPDELEDDERDATAASGKDPVATRSKDPVRKTAKGPKDSESSKAAGDTKRTKDSSRGGRRSDRAATGELGEKAKDAGDAASRRRPTAEGARSGRRVAAPSTMNPQWLAPVAVALLIVGLVYLVTYYLSAGTLPLPIGDWNLAAGFGIMLLGGGMLMFWK